MAVWPVGLPQSPLIDSYSESPPKVMLRSDMDLGPAKVRRRTTANVRLIECAFLIDVSQRATFDTFFNSTLEGGTLPFELDHPITGTTSDFRFVEEPTYSAVSGSLYFHLNCRLEILP